MDERVTFKELRKHTKISLTAMEWSPEILRVVTEETV